MKRNIFVFLTLALSIYFLGYLYIRQTRAEIWEKDGNVYVIFPDNKVYLYYFYRPLSYLDGNLTGMRFHIGQHR